jgi:protein-tyrosine phosphatase
MMRNFVDYHCHLLPCCDDGAVDQQESLAMARVLAGFGFATVHCTPHLIAGTFENPPQRVRQATASLQRLLDDCGIELRLVPGTEHYLDEQLMDKIPGALTPGSPPHLLLEVPFRSRGEGVSARVAQLQKQGLRLLVAHPERCSALQPERGGGARGALTFLLGRRKGPTLEGSLLAGLLDSGCRFQGNLGSFAGVYGSEVQQTARFFLSQGVYCCLGSDAHTSQGLAQILAEGFEVVVGAFGEEGALRLLRGF